jgi:hypothetical protein
LLIHGWLRYQSHAVKEKLRQEGARFKLAELLPARPMEEGNASAFLREARQAIVLAGPIHLSSRSVAANYLEFAHRRTNYVEYRQRNPWPEAEAWARTNWHGFSRLHGILAFTNLQYHPDYLAGASARLAYLQELTTTLQALEMHSYAALRLGEPMMAFSNVLAAVHLVSIWPGEPLLVTQRRRFWFANMAAHATWEIVEAGVLKEPELAQLAATWSKVDLLKPLPAANRMEVALAAETIQELRRSHAFYQRLLRRPAVLDEASQLGVRVYKEPFASLQHLGRVASYYPLYRWFYSYVEEQRALSASHQSALLLEQALKQEHFPPELTLRRPPGNYDMYTQALTTGIDFHLRALQAQATKDTTLAALAAHRFKQKHGRFPERLDELVPEYLPKVPTDCADGKPLRYRRLETGRFLLYSVGADRIDAGGVELKLDVVWPIPATAQLVSDFENRHGGPRRAQTP